MKKLLLFICFLAVGNALFAQVPSQVLELTFQVGISDPTKSMGSLHCPRVHLGRDVTNTKEQGDVTLGQGDITLKAEYIEIKN